MTQLPTSTEAPAAPVGTPAMSAFEDPAYRVAVVDLLGGLAYSELSAFERLTEDASVTIARAE